jgi:carbonic anhydrase/acetyltransferase-like protein (isoleucine patch superfamily)
MAIIPYLDKIPSTGKDLFLAPDAWLIGDVSVGDNVSIFFGAVLRGDINPIKIGTGSNIQEQAVLHTSWGLGPCVVGENVTVGHGAILHGCTIEDHCIIGMGSTILDNAVIGHDSLVGANSLVTMNTVIPPNSLVLGSPAKVVRQLTEKELKEIRRSAKAYQEKGIYYKNALPS